MSTIIGVLLLVVLNIFTFFSSIGLLNDYEKESFITESTYIRKQLKMVTDDICAGGIDSYSTLQVQDRNQKWDEIQRLSSTVDGRIIILDNRFRILADSYDLNGGEYYFSDAVRSVMEEGTASVKRLNNDNLHIIVPIKENNQVVGAVMAISALKERNLMYEYLSDKRVVRFGIFLVFSILASVGIIYFIGMQFKKVQNELDTIAYGHTDEPLGSSIFSEFDRMAESFNQIIGRYMDMENSRQEFVSNVSHELKTPITSMKIMADSLLGMDGIGEDVYKEFLQDIAHEIDRENQIITDLLALVKLDKTHASLNISPININELLSMLVKRVSPIAQKRNITLTLDTFRNVVAEVDEIKLSLAINNILENAVKYNNDGGKVKVYLNADHKFCYIRIRDTGVGIPEDCVDRIFERFYRVDKARSRDTGGTGLGLALTRNVILLHKGSVKVYSKPGEGSTFIVRIPLNYVS